MSNKKVCKPGYNSCEVRSDGYVRASAKVSEPAGNVSHKKCKPGFSRCSFDGEPRNAAPEAKVKGCRQGYNSCEF